MDYGKLAYLKTEDLERMVGRLSNKQTDFTGARAYYEIGRTIDGEYAVTEIKGSGGGNVCMIIKFYATAEKKSYLDVLIGGKAAARQIVDAGGKEYLILLQSKIFDNAELSLNASGVFIKQLELMIIGGAAATGGRRLSGDSSGGNALVIEVIDEEINLFEGEERGMDFAGNKKSESVGRAADAACIDGRFYMLILDLYGNLWLRDFDSGCYKFLGNGLNSCAALTASAGGLCAAAIKGGSIIVYDLDSFEDAARPEKADIIEDITDIKFAKGTDRPVLAAQTKNGGSFFVLAEREIKTADTIRVAIRATAG